MPRSLHSLPRVARIVVPPACTLTLAVMWLAACAGSALPEVNGPLPRLDPAPAEPAKGVVAHLPKEWILYSQPPATYGVPVLSVSGGTEWEVTGRWSAGPDVLEGQQYWVLMGPIWDWYRLSGDVVPWGRVALWGQLPPDWIAGDPVAAPRVEPPWGEPWQAVPYSRGHVLAVPADGQLALHACPETDCPVLERPVRNQAVPVTGQFTDGGRLWYRVEFRQQVLWAEAASGRLAVSWAGRLRRGGAEAAGYRSCEPVVMFPPPPHTLCPVNAAGRFLDLFEREYDRLDPVFGRLPRPEQGKAGAAAPVVPAVSETGAAARRVDYRAPGTYPHDLPGLDYHFELVFSDESTMWDWAVADMDACGDALRAHLGDLPARFGLQRAEIILSDPFVEWDLTNPPLEPYTHQGSVPRPGHVSWPADELESLWPAWEDRVPPDFALVHVSCTNLPYKLRDFDLGEYTCALRPLWGHTDNAVAEANLNAAAVQAMATYLGSVLYGPEGIKARHWEEVRTKAQAPYLYPRDWATGAPAGNGPCPRLIAIQDR